jgi:hypothetical protein
MLLKLGTAEAEAEAVAAHAEAVLDEDVPEPEDFWLPFLLLLLRYGVRESREGAAMTVVKEKAMATNSEYGRYIVFKRNL